jgi:hypothetical protein
MSKKEYVHSEVLVDADGLGILLIPVSVLIAGR